MNRPKKQLQIIKNGSLIQYSSLALTHDFLELPPSLTAKVNESLQKFKANPLHFLQAAAKVDQAAYDLFELYGKKLFASTIALELSSQIYDYDALQIFDKREQNIHWELLHDGKRFCYQQIPIIRGYPADTVHNQPASLAEHKLQVAHLAGLLEPGFIADQPHFARSGLMFYPWQLSRQPPAKVSQHNLGVLSRRKLVNMVHGKVPAVVVIAAYCDDQGLVGFNEQSGKLERISFYTFGSILKSATLKGLQGLIFQFWNYRTNQPAVNLQQWLKTASLRFGLEINGLLATEVTTGYLSSLFAELSLGKEFIKAHSKSLARLSASYSSSLLACYFRAHTIKGRSEQLTTSLKKSPALSLVDGYFPPLNQRFPDKLTFSSFAVEIARYFMQSSPKSLFLTTTSYQSLEDNFFSWLALFFEPGELKELILPFNTSGIDLLTKLGRESIDQAYSHSLWNELVSIDCTVSKPASRLLIIHGKMPANPSFHSWLAEHQANNWVVAQLYAAKIGEELNAESLSQDKLKIKEVFRDYHRDLKLSADFLPSFSSPLAQNSLWQFFWPELDQQRLNELLGLAADDFYSRVQAQFLKLLTAKEQQLLCFLYLFYALVPMAIVTGLFGSDLPPWRLRRLCHQRLINISVDGKLLWLHPGLREFFSHRKFFDPSHLIRGGRVIVSELPPSFADFTATDRRYLFLSLTNLAEHLAFLGDYQTAINLMLLIKERLALNTGLSQLQLIIWGSSCISWMSHLNAEAYPNWAERIWSGLLADNLLKLPSQLAINFTKHALEGFAQAGQWSGYSLALASLAGLVYKQPPENQRLFVNLVQEA